MQRSTAAPGRCARWRLAALCLALGSAPSGSAAMASGMGEAALPALPVMTRSTPVPARAAPGETRLAAHGPKVARSAPRLPVIAALRPAPPPFVAPPSAAPKQSVRPRRRVPPDCTADAAWCITPIRYLPDLCRTIEGVSREAGIDPHFLARLVWQESLFDPYAISPVGALGIAQFMPGTAALRGLANPFNPAEALRASASYLADLRAAYGNLGLAAAAYNGGEGRMERYLAGRGGLPLETRAYVYKITGLNVRTWRDDPPDLIDLALDPDLPFQPACLRHASRRGLPQFDPGGAPMPWAMIYAAHADRALAEAKARQMQADHPELLGEADGAISRTQLPGRRLWTAQIGQTSMAAASKLCNRLRHAGGGCMVLRN